MGELPFSRDATRGAGDAPRVASRLHAKSRSATQSVERDVLHLVDAGKCQRFRGKTVNAVRMDNDNLIKPIQDAMNRTIYLDDRLITDTHVRKTALDGSFKVRKMSRVLADAFVAFRRIGCGVSGRPRVCRRTGSDARLRGGSGSRGSEGVP